MQVRGSALSVQSYGHVIGTAVRITAEMFAQSSGADRKELIRALLKEVNKTAHDSVPINLHSATLN